MQVINWKLASHPLNWVTLFLMVAIMSIAIHFVLSYQVSPKKDAA